MTIFKAETFFLSIYRYIKKITKTPIKIGTSMHLESILTPYNIRARPAMKTDNAAKNLIQCRAITIIYQIFL